MKKKWFLFLPIMITSALLSSCSFDQFFVTKITSIAISDNTQYYAAGDVYADECDLTITANYNNGKSKEFDLSSIDSANLYRLSGEEHIEQNYKAAFSASGDYFFSVIIDGIESNAIEFNVLAEHRYVQSIEISGPSALNTKETGHYSLTISPSDYTTKLNFSCSYDKAFTFTKTATGFDAFAVKAGDHKIIVSSQSAKGVTISSSIDVSVTAVTQLVSMEQTYNDYIKNNIYPLSSCPAEGEVKLLVIPVWLKDSSYFVRHKDNVRNDIYATYFGSTIQTGWQSVSSYYYEESFGKLKLSGTVSDWYETSYSYKDIGSDKFNTASFVKNAVNWYFNNNPSDSRSNYDYDDDGYLDGVIVIYAAPDCQQTGFSSYENLWAYCFWIQENRVPYTITPNVFFWASYDFMYNTNMASRRAGTRYGNGDTSYCNLDAHTYIHEMGHVLGLEDYYDYSKAYNPAGGFSMQDYNVGGHDPYSLLAMGWADAYIPEDDVTITISEFTKSHDLILLTTEFNEYNSPFDEYLLLELYSPNDLNAYDTLHRYCGNYPVGPTKCGIRVWHVDARLMTTTNKISYQLTGNANAKGSVKVATGMANTNEPGSSSNQDYKQYLSKLGSAYYKYDLLHLIRNNTKATYQEKTDVTIANLFTQGSSFNANSFAKQFANTGKFDNGKDIGWSFTVDSIELVGGEAQATITLHREA